MQSSSNNFSLTNPATTPGSRSGVVAAGLAFLACGGPCAVHGAAPSSSPPPPAKETVTAPTLEGAAAVQVPPIVGNLNIREFRVTGAKALSRVDIEKAVYPFLGPGRTDQDVTAAAAALIKAYADKGFSAVAVEPDFQMRRGVMVLKVQEMTVGRLRVRGSDYFQPSKLKAQAPSMAEGTFPNAEAMLKDLKAMNRWSDRRVKPELKPGIEPGTVDIDLNVEDRSPLHASIEMNNRYSADTKELRVNASLSYTNLWQAGHSMGLSFQVAPERPEDAKVFSGWYMAPVENMDGLSLMLMGTKQDSNVNTLGGAGVAGRGEVVGVRAIQSLPGGAGFYQSLTMGMDYKHFEENVVFAGVETQTPITYFPLSLNYSGTWVGKKGLTELNAGVNFGLRGMGADTAEFDSKRYNATGNFFYLRGDLSRLQELPHGFQAFAKVQGQASGEPLINSEQFAGGGLGSVRGYLESEVLGDNALLGTVELRSPSFLKESSEKSGNEWRFHLFCDAGRLSLNSPLPEQTDTFDLITVGLGTRFQVKDHFHGSLDLGFPLIEQTNTEAGEARLSFRFWADF